MIDSTAFSFQLSLVVTVVGEEHSDVGCGQQPNESFLFRGVSEFCPHLVWQIVHELSELRHGGLWYFFCYLKRWFMLF